MVTDKIIIIIIIIMIMIMIMRTITNRDTIIINSNWYDMNEVIYWASCNAYSISSCWPTVAIG